jgi:hypothetical protein
MAAAPRTEGRVDVGKPTGFDEYLAPNFVEVGDPDQLADLLQSYAWLAKAALPREVIDRKVGHEAQHREASLAMGATAVTHGLVVVAQPEWRWRTLSKMHHYQLCTVSSGLTEDELLVARAYPEVLSPDDKVYLGQAGMTVEAIDQLAQQQGLPQPLSISRQQGPA